MCVSISFISCQQTENSTAENPKTILSSIREENIDLNTTSLEVEKNQSSVLIKEFKNETKESDTIQKEKLDINLTEISAEKNQSVLSTKEFLTETENMVSLINSLMTNSSITPENGFLKSSSIEKSNVNYTMESSPSKNVEIRDDSEIMEKEKPAASSKLMQGIQLLKNNHNLSTSANNLFKLVVPYVNHGNPRAIGIWKVPREVLITNKEGRDVIRPASVIESKSFITKPKISSVRLNLAFPETLKTAVIESRSPMGYEDSPDYDSREPYSSNESDESPESDVETDDGRFLEDDYRKEIEQEAEAFIKKQKAENATNNDRPSSAENENPGSMENNFAKSIETGNGPHHMELNPQEGYFTSHEWKRPIETNSQQGYFTSQEGNRPTDTNSQQGYFSSHNGNKVFFYKGNDNFFNIDDVFPLLKFDQMYNQPLIDDYPEGFYVPLDHSKSFLQVGHSENLTQFLHTVDSHVLDKENYHSNNEAPDIHNKYHSSIEDSPCSQEQNDIEGTPESDPGIVSQDYQNSEPNYDKNNQHSAEFDGEITPLDYPDNENHKNTFDSAGNQPEYDSRENYKLLAQEEKHYDERNLPHNPNIDQGELEYERKKLQVHQYQMHQKYQAEHHEEKSTFRKNAPQTPYHFHSESSTQSKPEAQIKSIENYSGAPHNQKESIPAFNHNTPTPILNHNFIPSHNPNFNLHNQNKNPHIHQQHNQYIKSPHGQNIMPHNYHNDKLIPPFNHNQQHIRPSHQNFKPPHIHQNPHFRHPPHPGNQNFIPSQVQKPDVQSKENFRPVPDFPKVKPDCPGSELHGGHQNDARNQPSYHEQKHFESPHSVAIAIARSTNLALGRGVRNQNARYPISTLMALASSERNIEKTPPKKKSKRSKQNPHIKRSKTRKRNRRKHSKKNSKKQRKTRRSTRDNMKAEAATYHWGLENHKGKDGFFM